MDLFSPESNEHYDDNYDLSKSIMPTDEEYFHAINKLGDEIEYFTEMIRPQDERRFAALVALYEDVQQMEKRRAYDQGFNSAISMVLDVNNNGQDRIKPI